MPFQPPDLMGQAIQFRKVMSQPIATDNTRVQTMQLSLIVEESAEFLAASGLKQETSLDFNLIEPDINQLKELVDLVYVCFQYAAAMGWPLDEALDRVHASNMSKLVDGKPLRREDGKVLKGPNYKPPYLDDLV